MKMGRPVKELAATEAERSELEAMIRRSSTGQAVALRARIVLACAGGKSNTEVAAELGVGRMMAGRWRERFRQARISGLKDKPKSGRVRRLTDLDEERVVKMTLETRPKGATHWSARSMAEASGLSRNTVHRIWRKYKLQPHRTKTFKLSKDRQFVEKVRDVVGLYLNPPERAIVLCVDEKTQIQALDRTQPMLQMRPGQVERRTHDYKRHGTTSLFAALDCATGKVIGEFHQRHRAEEFIKFLITVDRSVQSGLDVHVIMDRGSACGDPLRHPQDQGGQGMALKAPQVPFPLHSHKLFLDQPRGAALLQPHYQTAPQGSPQERRRTQSGDNGLP